MRQKHTTHHLLGFLVTLVIFGGALGILSGSIGRNVIDGTNALRGDSAFVSREERIQQRTALRRLRREARMQRSGRMVSDVGITYPMRSSSLHATADSVRWDVSLNTGTFTYPRLNISAPIGKPSMRHWNDRNWRELENQMQFGLLNGVVAYPHSPSFGQQGNIVIAGHSSAPTMETIGSAYEDVFAMLPNARLGDRMTLVNEIGIQSTYEVIESKEVSAQHTSILLQDPSKKELTAFTCYPVGTTLNRWMVRARLVETEVAAW